MVTANSTCSCGHVHYACSRHMADGMPCHNPVVSRGRCSTHYQQLRRWEKGQGPNPDDIEAMEKTPHQVATRVNDFAKAHMDEEVAIRVARGETSSHYDLAREIIHEWAEARQRKKDYEQSPSDKNVS